MTLTPLSNPKDRETFSFYPPNHDGSQKVPECRGISLSLRGTDHLIKEGGLAGHEVVVSGTVNYFVLKEAFFFLDVDPGRESSQSSEMRRLIPPDS
jgi:hypothetical protein